MLSKMVATCYDGAPEVWPISRLRSQIHRTELFLGLGQVENTYHRSTREMAAGELECKANPSSNSELQASLDYRERICLKQQFRQ